MLQIPFLENTETLFMAGEDLDRVWHGMCQRNGDHRMDTCTIIHHYSTACPAEGCHHCANPECPYAEFIQHYWNHPRCD